ncbi:MAG: hypothetical protein ACE5K7_04520 [Phycisphaerae bacterium]
MERSIVGLPEYMARLDASERALVEGLYDVASPTGQLVVPDRLRARLARWYARPGDADASEAVARACSQRVVRVLNRWSFEATLFNELRACRPMNVSRAGQLEPRLARPSDRCDFCDPENFTTADVWGRLRGRHCITAANAAKYDAVHGLVIFSEHHPLRFDQDQFEDYLSVALAWMRKWHERDGRLVYPMLLWNCLEKAAASQVHGHMQVLLTSGRHYGQQELFRDAAGRYAAATGRNYLNDLLAVHELLGLSWRQGSATCLAHLTPKKEKEVLIVDRTVSADLIAALFAVLRSLIDRLGVVSFNVGLYMPPLEPIDGWEGFPVIARLVDRGDPARPVADVGGMEFYASSVVASDPYRLVEALTGR